MKEVLTAEGETTKDRNISPECLLKASDLNDSLRSVLPESYSYIIKEYEEKETEHFTGAPQQAFSCTALINIQTEEEAKKWLKNLSEKNKTTYRIA